MTVTLPAVPAVVEVGKPDTTRVLAAAGDTLMFDSVPVIEEVLLSVAVIDCVPAVFKVALNVCIPASPDVNV